MTQSIQARLGWGVLGTGFIARAFATALLTSDTGVLTSVGSRVASAAALFADTYSHSAHPAASGSYGDVVQDPHVDAVYIALPNDLHLPWIRRSARARKHILCEKPLALTAEEATAAFEAAHASGVTLIEAQMYRCHPQMAAAQRLIKDGAVGQVRLIEATAAYIMNTSTGIRLDPAHGGGVILDLGVYGMSAARLLAGAASGDEFADPDQLRALGVRGASGVDEYATAVALFAGDIVATVTCGYRMDIGDRLTIWGSDGSLEVYNPWLAGAFGPQGKLVLTKGRNRTVIDAPMLGSIYAIEADSFAAAVGVAGTASVLPSVSDTLGNMRALDRWRAEVESSILS